MPNFGPGTSRARLADWADLTEDLGYDLLMTSDHLVITPDVAEQYPAPFFEPLTTLAWLAGRNERLVLGTTVLILPYRHPLQVARVAANLAELSGGRFVLGVGIGWAKQEFAVLGVDHGRRGALSDEYLATIRRTWRETPEFRDGARVPVWVGGNSAAGRRRAVRFGDAWHPINLPLDGLRHGLDALRQAADQEDRPMPAFAPRLALRITDRPVDGADRPAGTGTEDQVRDDLVELTRLGAESIVFDTFTGDMAEIADPQPAWRQLRAIAGLRGALTAGS
ncbi:TIGR03619 family F420-dependent LLM class oxidoreductase [Streptomyces sp. TS71-3]|uniref:TIGR03619 family F420-dependent LLM class oxidoreductase n=1 Tax=Streptomyces sp. TS71-3 TaxID=2733862 RepID=UPI002016D74D|nr:TIGR03619 family F420-dependent LLM class oxidoreductase [Streptomyces sp. TS71-3]